MIQDILPQVFRNEFEPRLPEDEDLVFCFHNNEVLMFGVEECLLAPTVEMIRTTFEIGPEALTYLFTIDEDAVFLLTGNQEMKDSLVKQAGYDFHATRIFRTLEPKWIAFAGITASHLESWYRSNQYCGCCGEKMAPKEDERAMVCGSCGFVDYPKICPAVIVGIKDGDKIILTKYANNAFARYALVAGFCEIGETVEGAIRREVLEEVGVKIKNLTYFNSQPWGFSESLLLGFFADLDGDSTITLDQQELKEGVWMSREEIPDDIENELSLTYTMMQAFKRGEV